MNLGSAPLEGRPKSAKELVSSGASCGPSGIEILGGIVRFPFDVAADTGCLFSRNWFACQNRVQRPSQVSPRDRDTGIRPTCIQLAAVDQFLAAVEYEKVRCACGFVRDRYRLILIKQIRKGIPSRFRFMHHLLW